MSVEIRNIGNKVNRVISVQSDSGATSHLSVMSSDIFHASTQAADSFHDQHPDQVILHSPALFFYDNTQFTA